MDRRHYLDRAAGHKDTMATQEPSPSAAEAGRQAYRARRFTEAARLLAAAVRGAPHDASLRLMLARALEQDHQLEPARLQLRYVLASAAEATARRMAFEELTSLDVPGELLGRALVRARKLEPGAWARAQAERRADETPLAALLRMGPVGFQDLVEARFGPHGLPALHARPFAERLGARLIAGGQLTQFQVKQALQSQAVSGLPLGEIVQTMFQVSSEVVRQARARQGTPQPRLADADALGPILVRWGVLTPEQWHDLRGAGGQLPSLLVSRKLALRGHLERAQRYQKSLTAALMAHEHRLGALLVEAGVLEREALGRVLASQMDQPFPLGEVLVMQRLVSPEAVLEALMTQHRRLEEQVEATLPPMPEPEPPPPPVVEAPAPPRDRRLLWGGLAASLLVIYAGWYGLRFGARQFAWLAAVPLPDPPGFRTPRPPQDTRPEGTTAEQQSPEMSSQIEPLQVPGAAPMAAGRPGELTATMQGAMDRFPGDAPPALPPGPGVGLVPGTMASPELAFGAERPAADRVAYPMQGRDGVTPAPAVLPTPVGALPELDHAGVDRSSYARRAAEGATPVRAPMQPAEGAGPAVRVTLPQVPVVREGPANAPASADLDPAAVDRTSALFRYRLGVSFYEQHRYQNARTEFVAARRADPRNPLPLFYLGQLAVMEGDRGQARAMFAEYLRRMPHGEHEAAARAALDALGPGVR